jgi:hypothetical protein
MLKLEIDSRRKTIHAEVELKGESEPVQIRVGAYSVAERDGKLMIELDDVSASREWLELLVQDLVKSRPIEAPRALKIVL